MRIIFQLNQNKLTGRVFYYMNILLKIGGLKMKQDYEKPELIVYEDLSDVTMGEPSKIMAVVD